MRQVTGNSIIRSGKMVSIQLPLGGHSFSVGELGSDCAGDKVETLLCNVLTPRTTLVPRECFDAACAEHYLRVAGLPCRADETAVTSDPTAQIIAVMAVSSQCLTSLRQTFGQKLQFTSPLCGNQNFSEPTVWLHRAGDIIYIKVYKPVLRLAEAVEISSESDVLQLLHDLGGVYGIASCTILCSGDGCDRLRRRLAKYYPSVRCE